MKYRLLNTNNAGLLIVLLGLLASCTSTTVDEFRQGETGIENDESVVILGRRQASDYETRSEFVECVGERMTRGDNSIRVVPEQEFVDAMFPWFEPRTAPLRTRDLEQLMAEDVVATKMNEFGIRYIVWLDGFTETSDRSGSISCAIGPGGGGCFGFGTWEDDANFDARVWDVGSLSSVGTINTDATGQSYLPALILPIPLIARVEANACSRLATQLKQFVLGS
ncbi:MAG TPA: hypothetical protein DCM64_04400 [Gammaproteobacteria bacterium]|jgi:hypothetical protein|nr:hypothetical protein [Gammaproteobacteria bacterium]MDP6733478.1 hypothetical protein [Gammaproteobacteria bacterium]HAJ75677.1 hypothetical protein [Gammaproteobacteria bacterium]|tara:strand:- start:336 stop:1007 length:672 start_codon:yes stop_codon:yes gene_type:complete